MAATTIPLDNSVGFWSENQTISAGNSGTITVPRSYSGFLVLTGYNPAVMGLYLLNTSSASNPTLKVATVLAATDVTLSVSGRTLTISNGGSYATIASLCSLRPEQTRV